MDVVDKSDILRSPKGYRNMEYRPPCIPVNLCEHPGRCRQHTKGTRLHHLGITYVIRCDKNDCKGRVSMRSAVHASAADTLTLGIPRCIDLLENLHGVWSPASHFAVPQQEALGFNVSMDETADCWSKCFLLVGAWQIS